MTVLRLLVWLAGAGLIGWTAVQVERAFYFSDALAGLTLLAVACSVALLTAATTVRFERLRAAPLLLIHVFVNRVFELSQGSLPIMLEAIPTGQVTEAGLLQHVAAGGADIGFVGTRVLDQAGIRAFQPLSAPLLVQSYPAQAAVVSDPTVVGGLSELDRLGVSGLALMADELSLPVGVHGPAREPADYAGATVRVDASDAHLAAAEALGGSSTTTPLMIEPRPPYDIYDTSLRSFVERYHDDFARTLTINLPLWPQAIVLFANPQSLQGLTDEQRSWIRTAAADAARWSIEHAGEDVDDELAQLCSRGGQVVTATPAQRDALLARLQPVYQQLRADPDAGPMLDHVESLIRATPGGDAETGRSGCPSRPSGSAQGGSPPQAAPTLGGPGRTGSLPQGTYRTTIGAAESGDLGVVTWTMNAGRWTSLRDNGPFPECSGDYDVDGDLVTFHTTQPEPLWACAPPAWTARWQKRDDLLVWSQVSLPDYATDFAGDGWTEIG